MTDKEKLQAIKEEIERRIKNLSSILNIGNTEDLTKEEEYGHCVERETLDSLLFFINSLEYPSPKFKIGDTIRDKEGKTGAFTITDIKVEDKSLVYLGNKRQKVSIWCQDDYEIVNNDLLVKEKPSSEGLEEAAKEHASNLYGEDWIKNEHVQDDGFKAISNFKFGAEWQKQQIMKDAVEGIVGGHTDIPAFINLEIEHKPNVKVGDKVKIVVLKTE